MMKGITRSPSGVAALGLVVPDDEHARSPDVRLGDALTVRTQEDE